MDDVAWGQVDLVWTIIFLLILAFFMYWAYIVFTEQRTKIGTVTSKPPDNIDIEEYEYYEIDDDAIQI